ncbi:HTH-type transcriptional repressor AseR [Methylomusa anaerophila]|uniref:HTH-type transcriptional repressor AseR n=1 Tax=Methylomusa anaerophila TaxID=1930071 RepID=A0A348AG61_9FIRM|nr:HTH-type transcriptional repressor AseR [Methylomusa anaerophila]
MKLVKIFKVLGDETRIRIVNLLRNSELCVCEITYALGATQSNISKHLAKLSDSDFVVSSKKAQWISYKINPALLAEYPFIQTILNQEMTKIPQCQEDLAKLAECQSRGIPLMKRHISSSVLRFPLKPSPNRAYSNTLREPWRRGQL